jgi:hypothetical protein
VNDRTNFSKNKLLFPIFGLEGKTAWGMVMSMTCPKCKTRINANDGAVLASIPSYAATAYPVQSNFALSNKNCHLGRSATDVFDLLSMPIYGNGDLCSRLLYNGINRAYLERVGTYYSINAGQSNTLPYLQKDGEYIRAYPLLGDTIREYYNEACSSSNQPWQLRDHDQHVWEIQSDSCNLLFAEDHTQQVTGNYFRNNKILHQLSVGQ